MTISVLKWYDYKVMVGVERCCKGDMIKEESLWDMLQKVDSS